MNSTWEASHEGSTGGRQPVVVIGAGGHAKVVVETIRATGKFDVIGLVDRNPRQCHAIDAPMLGNDDILEKLRGSGIAGAVIALGDNSLRQRMGGRLIALNFFLPAIVHPSAFVSPSAQIGAGAVVMARAVIGTQTQIGELAIVNTGAVIDHDNKVGAAAHVAPGCALAGNVKIGARVLIGIGSAVRPGIVIGDDAIVGAGSAVVSDVTAGTTVVGVPARPLARTPG